MKADNSHQQTKSRHRFNHKTKSEAHQIEKDRQQREAVMHVSFIRYKDSGIQTTQRDGK